MTRDDYPSDLYGREMEEKTDLLGATYELTLPNNTTINRDNDPKKGFIVYVGSDCNAYRSLRLKDERCTVL
jgi:hypothetical protein